MEEKRLVKKRLAMFLPAKLHKEIHKRAIERNITMTKWIVRAIQERLKIEESYE